MLKRVQRSKEFPACPLIGRLRRREPSTINTVVNVLVEKCRQLSVLRLDLRWKEFDVACRQAGKFMIEHPANIVLRVVDDPLHATIPEHRYSESAAKAWIGCEIRLA